MSAANRGSERRRNSNATRSMLRSSVAASESQGRRRSSASSITLDLRPQDLEAKTSIFCPLPMPKKKGFLHNSSRAYKQHKLKRKEKQKELSDDGSGSVDDDIPLKHGLTRRKRNSFVKNKNKEGGGSSRGGFEPTNVTAYLAARVESEKPNVKEVYNHSAPLMNAWGKAGVPGGVPSKSHMMDVALVGKDDVPIHASRFILGCYSPVLEEVFFKERQWVGYDAVTSNLSIDFATEPVIRAAIHHCFCGEIPTGFEISSPSEDVARNLAQLDHLAHVYKFGVLGEVTYRALRKLINRRAVLACAIFDELSHYEGAGTVDSIKSYALDSMREMPMDTLLAGGVQWMREPAVEAIMQDPDMDVDEFYMFKILNAWAATNKEGGPSNVARRLSEYIELKYIDPELIMSQVKESGFFDEKDIVEAVRLIKDSLANRDPHEMERVLVEGAGTDNVNGIYCRVEDELGMGDEEILFVKEADDGYSDVGLYLWGTKWHLAMCSDYSNCFYSCEDTPNKPSTELVPGTGWIALYGGSDPPPLCTYLPNKRTGRNSITSEKSLLAPNLEEMMDPTIAEKRRSIYFDKRTDDVAEKRVMTLEQMMNLPEDRQETHS